MNTVDLHGMSHEQAIRFLENNILLELKEPGNKIKIITGNSITLQKKIQKQIVEKYNLSSYIITNNLGAIIITGI